MPAHLVRISLRSRLVDLRGRFAWVDSQGVAICELYELAEALNVPYER